jgi:archaeal flagellar protein FlaJ
MGDNLLEKVALVNNHESFVELFISHSLPITVSFLALGTIILSALQNLPWWSGFLIIVAGFLWGFGWPFYRYFSMKKDIEKHLYLFITYAGTISTMKISNANIFKLISEKKVFGAIGDIFEKITYLAKSWNMGYAYSCRRIARSCPSKILEDFLDRMAVSLDMGEEIGKFFIDEQKSVMNDFSTQYRQNLETLKMIQEIFVSFSISGALVMGIVLLSPLITDMVIEDIVLKVAIGFVLVDVLLLIMVLLNIIFDPLYTEVRHENTEERKLHYINIGCHFLALLIFISLLNFSKLSFIFVVAWSVLPLILPSFFAGEEESRLMKSDASFPVYIRAIGSSINVRQGAIASALQATQVHDFGILNEPSIRLYKRLKLGNDKYVCWDLFGSEVGTYLGYHFSRIFSQSVYLGGKAGIIGNIVSNNFQKILSLRKFKYQIKSSMRSAFYGAYFGLAATLYVSVEISRTLVSAFTSTSGGDMELSDFIGNMFPAGNIDFELIILIISVMLIIHAVFKCVILSVVHGTKISSYYFDLVFMIWICALLSWILPIFVAQMIPDISMMGAATSEVLV